MSVTNVRDRGESVQPSDFAHALREYSFNDLDSYGEDAGRLFAESFEEAAQLWALENLDAGEHRLLQVWSPSGVSRDYRVEREGNTATAETFTAEWCG